LLDDIEGAQFDSRRRFRRGVASGATDDDVRVGIDRLGGRIVKYAEVFRWVLTGLLVLLFAWLLWQLVLTWGNYAVDGEGKPNGPDLYARAKETLGFVAPLVTLALGYWFGVKGAETAKEGAETAKQEADAAKVEAATAQRKVETVLAEADPALIARLQAKHGGIFG
jgi:hypothetical protein